MKDKAFNRAILIWTGLVYAFLFLPIAVIVFMSFNANKYGALPYAFTTRWYVKLFTEDGLLAAAGLSFGFSLAAAFTAMILGTVTALGMRPLTPSWRGRYRRFISLPVVIPWLVQATSILMILNFIGWGRSYIGMFLGNTAVITPYVVMLTLGRFSDADDNTENAARTLGARPVRVFFDVTLPKLVPGILSGALMAFIMCFNSFCIQYYLAPFGVRTLPIEIFTLVRSGYTPDMNALAAVMALAAAGVALLLNKMGYSGKKLMNM
ncbi:MAG: ABC transporter permease [Candidatus Adiutrix sp.]|jgi:spermidine/putrescine transport system permease protein|nr:ABC transporter permease [Candidatus Adiutrix sp.]